MLVSIARCIFDSSMKRFLTYILVCIIVSFSSIAAYDFLVIKHLRSQEKTNHQKLVSEENDIYFSDRWNQAFTSSSPTDFISAAKRSREAVVSIQGRSGNQGFRSGSKSSGSGIIISPDGYIVTNNHVIKDADRINILLDDNREFKAEIVGTDPTTDIALLKIDSEQLPFLLFGNSDSLQIGEWVMAVGNPFRLKSTVTAGIVSAKARSINVLQRQGIESFIQTDAAVNPGNSGGAMVNTNGELVGIITAIISYSGKYEGFSFAIPANLAKKVIYDIREYGAVQRGWLGVTISKVDDKISKMLKMKRVRGVYVDLVTKESAAYDAGLKTGDIILEVNRKETNTVSEFMEQVSQYRPGDIIDLKYMHNGLTKEVKATLRNQLNTVDFIAVRKDKILSDLGFELRNLDSKEQQRLNTDGVYVVSIYKGSKISRTNMDAGYIITTFNNEEIGSVDQFIELLKEENDEVYLDGFYENYPGTYPYTFNK